MLLAMMFSCQPVSEDVGGSNNGGSNSGNQNGGNTGGGNDNENGENNSDNENNGNEPVYVYDFTIKVTNLPENVKALSLWGSCNYWKLENIKADKDSYIVDVIDGTATFAFDKIGYGTYLWCQFVPMTSKDMAMNDYTWWQTAFSGSSAYDNAENNLVYAKPLANKVTLTLDVSTVYGDIISEENVFVKRFNTENYANAFQVSTGECKYKIIYNGADGYSDYLMTSFDEEYDITLMNLGYKDDYKFAGWYETEDFSGNPITGWKAGEKKSDVTLYAKWDKAKEIIIRFNVNGEDDETTPDTIVTKEGTEIRLPYMGTYFSHWNTKADGSGKTYYSYAETRESVSFTEDTTLYAQWCEKVTITFNANGGSGVMEKQIIPAGKYSSLAENTFTAAAGYFFSHWNTKADDSGLSYSGSIKITKDTTLYAQWGKDVAVTVTGVYSYKLDITDISGAWGGNTMSPAFSVVLLTDEQLVACQEALDFRQASMNEPEYQIGAFGNMKIADTSQTGNYAIYGSNAVDYVYQYYDGVAVTVTDTTFELFVDMSEIVKTNLKAEFIGGEALMTEDDIVDLTGYKPYVIALGTEIADPDNYVFRAWNGDVMKMTAGATFPTDLQYTAPVIPTCNDLKYIAGTMTEWNHKALTDNSFTFTADSDTEFTFTNGVWGFTARGATIYALNEEIVLSENSDANITFIDGVLTVGNEYVVTLIVKGEHEAYVKVTEK